MAINFPNNPSPGDTFTFNDVNYRWDGVRWDPMVDVEPQVISTNYTAAAGQWLVVDTSTTAITITLPTGTDGDVIRLTDFAGTWATNNVTLTGGSFLDASGVIQPNDFVLDINNFDVTAVFYSGAWRIR